MFTLATLLVAAVAVAAATASAQPVMNCSAIEVRAQSDVDQIVASIKAEAFSDNKVAALLKGVRSGALPLSPAQVVQLLGELTFTENLLDALNEMEPWLVGHSIAELETLLKVYTFSDARLQVLSVACNFIREDQFQKRFDVVEPVFTFSSDQEKARKILQDAQPFTCTWGHIRELRFNVAVDTSGSMDTRFSYNGTGYTRLSFVVRDLDLVVRTQLKTEQWFNLFSFSQSPVAWQPGLVQTNDTNINSAVGFLGRMSPGGCTNIADTITRAFQDKDLKAVYLLTDGAPTCGSTSDPAAIIKMATTLAADAGGIPIHTVAMTAGGSGSDEKAAVQFLKNLATATGGSFRGVTD